MADLIFTEAPAFMPPELQISEEDARRQQAELEAAAQQPLPEDDEDEF
jgi:GTP-binding nuclear protein Ran